jgi:uncharacterized Zn finger protein
MNHTEQEERDTPCPRCGADAEVSYLDEGRLVEIICTDCGRFEMAKEDFDQFTAEIVNSNQRE